MKTIKRLAFLGLLAVPASTAALAHHAAAPYFDMDKTITLEGTVDEFVFKAPHAVLKFNVTNEDGETELWRAETLPSNLLFRRGWRFNMFEPGEKVTVTGSPAKEEGRPAMQMQLVETGDGTKYNPFGE